MTMETEEERRARLENDAATKRLRLVMETEEERKARLVMIVATTQLRLALEAEDERSAKMEWIGYGFDLNLIWIEIGVFKNLKECARSPCNGNHFSSSHGIAVRPFQGSPWVVVYTGILGWQLPTPLPIPTLLLSYYICVCLFSCPGID